MIPKFPKPEVNSKIRVVPLQIVEPNRVYCHILIDDGKSFENMSKELAMAVKYGNLHKFEENEEPKIMELVFAQFSVDSCWYRAVVLNHYDDGDFKVFFVDFGNMERVSIKDLRKWSNRFEFLPFQAILCRLYNVKVVEHDRSSAIEFLESQIVEKYLDAIVIDTKNELVIDLLSESGSRFLDDYLKTGFVKCI